MSQKNDSTQMEFFPSSSPPGFHARTFPLQENKQASTGKGQGYGQSAPEFLGSFDPVTQSLKTSQLCLVETEGNGLSEFSGTYPRSGMMRSGTVYQLPNLARTTTGTGSGYWPTPDASLMNLNESVDTVLARRARCKEKHGNNGFGLRLQTAVKMWPTPTARDWKDGRKPYDRKKNGEATQDTIGRLLAKRGETKDGLLNPTWVEWLMGYPEGWTDLKD